jgi:hypothetical protein
MPVLDLTVGLGRDLFDDPQASQIPKKLTYLEQLTDLPLYRIQYNLNPEEFQKHIPSYIRENNLDAMRVVLDNGIDAKKLLNDDFDTVLTCIIKGGTPEMLRLFFEYHKPYPISFTDVLHLFEYGTPEIANELIDSRCKFKDVSDALRYCEGPPNLPVLKLLFARGVISGLDFETQLLRHLRTDRDFETYKRGMKLLAGSAPLNPFAIARALGEQGMEMIRTSIEQAPDQRPQYLPTDLATDFLTGDEQDLGMLIKFFKTTPSHLLIRLHRTLCE